MVNTSTKQYIAWLDALIIFRAREAVETHCARPNSAKKWAASAEEAKERLEEIMGAMSNDSAISVMAAIGVNGRKGAVEVAVAETATEEEASNNHYTRTGLKGNDG